MKVVTGNYFSEMDSPVGMLLLVGDESALAGLYMCDQKHQPKMTDHCERNDKAFRAAREQLKAYFAGKLQAFDVPLAAAGTDFQKSVWQQLCQIPYGRTWSYGELANRIGNSNASRAVGLANGRNPIGIVVPWSSRDRRKWLTHRLRRWDRTQAVAVAA